MSALAAIAQYSSDSESSDDVSENIHPHQLCAKKVRLPRPTLVVSGAVTDEAHCDEPAAHGGRVRAFLHERGNWPTYVYAQCPDSEWIDKLVAEARSCSASEQLERCSDLHVSLSRTTVLRYHWINTFTTTLQTSLRDIECIELELDSVKIYCNDEQTRTFIALTVDHFGSQKLNKITEKVDAALAEFKLPKYYENPSFHVSVVWCNGNKLSELTQVHQQLQKVLTHHRKSLTVIIDRIICKCGNKLFQFPLKC